MTRRAVVLAAALAAWGQAPVPQPTFRTEANYVRVDVYPTRDGAPVNDLTRDDFEILESGQTQKIEQFERVVLLTRYWHWGERGRLNPPDQRDEDYLSCYPGRGPIRCPDGTADDDTGVASEMIARRHELIRSTPSTT